MPSTNGHGPKKRASLYARVSGDEQKKRGYSLSDQRGALRGGGCGGAFRDRIARGVYAQLLSEEFRRHGARLEALNSRGDDSPGGELGDHILDVIAIWERKKIAERMNRGKRRKAKEGKVIAGPRPDYGFRYNENRDGYVVDEEKMALIRRIFRMVGVEGATLNTVRRTLEKEGVLNASGRKGWTRQWLRTRMKTTCTSRTSWRRFPPWFPPKWRHP